MFHETIVELQKMYNVLVIIRSKENKILDHSNNLLSHLRDRVKAKYANTLFEYLIIKTNMVAAGFSIMQAQFTNVAEQVKEQLASLITLSQNALSNIGQK